ncbi:MAG: exodeoxyribonuclease VII large subunit [Bacteriovoracaceae bacterium]|nr:exodeoxyribonuclease VII large subunit [Bacteriovoracaceae bacterium]
MIKRSVSDIVEEIRNTLEGEYREIIIEGEISNLSSSASGHWYFTLSDENASMRACLFKMDALRNPLIRKVKNGDKVECHGKVGVYVKRGEFQLIAKKVLIGGVGDLKLDYENLKRQLAADGLFDQEHKKNIPLLPKRVAVITAEKAAALQDFLNIFHRRSLWMDVVLSPALVQGNDAPASIVGALHRILMMDKNSPSDKKIDLIVITRGGGSMEDLWAFNDEALAYEIFNCPIPVISAVGHEVDYTICDYVSDLRCETPSAAAEIITETMVTIIERLKSAVSSLERSGRFISMDSKRRLEEVGPVQIVDIILSRFYKLKSRFERVSQIKDFDQITRFSDKYLDLDRLIDDLFRLMDLKIKNNHLSLEKQNKVLHALNPKQVLVRGYSYIQTKEGKVISNIKKFDSLDSGSQVKVIFSDGSGIATKS